MPTLPTLEVQVSFADCPQVDWQVVRLRLDEGVNQPYTAVIELETDDADADTGALLGATCELSLGRGEHAPRTVFGVVARVDYRGHNAQHLFASVTVVPAFSLARHRNNSRIWQGESVQAIVEQVLDASLAEYGRSVEFGHLQRGAKPRDYCIQYRETDLDFVSRLLEEEGVSYYFAHELDVGHEVLTLSDNNDDYPDFANVAGSPSLPLIAHNPDEADLESIQSFAWARHLRPTTVALSEYDMQSPGAVSAEEAGEADERGRVRRLYDHGQRRFGTAEMGRRANDLAAAQAVEGSLAVCEGNVAALRPGHRFALSGVDHEGTPEEWIAVKISHSFDTDEQGVTTYRNEVECIPADVEIRPLEKTRKPAVRGPQTATVVGGGEIDVDDLGRIQVQFHWPENPSFAAGASCRVRCAQSWAGAGWGAQFIPRVGMEVVVEFLEGNPDRPLVTGCVYNGANAPPFGLPGNSTQSGWRTNSSPGGGGSNELRFEDAAGGEEIYLHGQRDWNTVVKRNKAQIVGNDETLSVANNRQKTVEVDEQIAIGANQQISVGADQVESVGANQALIVGSNQQISVGVDQALSVGANQSETVGANQSETVAFTRAVTVGGMLATVVGGAMNTLVGAAHTEEVGGIKMVTVGASSSEGVGGSKSVEAGSISHSAGTTLSQSAGKDMSLSVGEDLSVAAKGAVNISGKKKGLIELQDELTIRVGKASISLKKNGDVAIKGLNLSLDGKGAISLKAKQVNHK